MSNIRDKPLLLDSVFVKPAESLREVPAQTDGEDVDESEQSEGVEQHHCVLQEGQSCVDNTGTSQVYKVTMKCKLKETEWL